MTVKRTIFTGNAIYVIDTSSLIELHNRYPRSVFPTIWKRIESMIQDNQLVSHIEAYREIQNTNNPKDALLRWSKKQKKMFQSIDECQNGKLPQIQAQYDANEWQNKLNRPGPWADPYLLALAMCEQATVVTQESKTKPNRNSVSRQQLGGAVHQSFGVFSRIENQVVG